MNPSKIKAVMGLAAGISLLASSFLAAEEKSFDENLLKAFTYRSLGPAVPGGRITDLAVAEDQPYTFYVASATGGLWKTVNNGTTFDPVFDDQTVISLGDVAVAPSDSRIVWVGTGEASNARSTYWGDGVYKSVDAGKTWENKGLRETHHVGRIVIHPQNPDTVYVAAMGHLFSTNAERGLYKTSDGGETWEKVLYINESVGVIDVALNPDNPDVILAAAYDKQRFPWHFEAAGPESGIYKSSDGGKTWKKLGGGLPGGRIGRIGLDIYRKDPRIVYATVENANPAATQKPAAKKSGTPARTRTVGGEIYRSDDMGETWRKMNPEKLNIGGNPGYYYGQIRIDPNDENVIYVLSVTLYRSEDGGKSWGSGRDRNAAPMTHSDHHALWIDPRNSDHLLLGNDGGLYASYDRGKSWDHFKNIPLAQFYAVGVDMDHPYNVYGGLQDNGSWKGPSNGRGGQIVLRDWSSVGGGDGFYNQVDPHDSRWLYNESQFGMVQRVDQNLGITQSIRPRRERGQPELRFNWNTPIHISPHNSQIIYIGANVLFRSMNRGDDWQEISPDLTLNDPVKIAGQGNIQYCTIVTISESPITPGLIWVGTDDGRVHLTDNGGGTWTDITASLAQAGAPEEYWVSRVFASSHEAGTVYVTKTGYRRDDFRPFIYKTEDFGKTWTSLSSGLPSEPINVVFQDRKNPDLLFVGTDMAVYVSINDGKTWVRMRNNMPTNPVHDLLIHPRENDLVVATHGRGIFITDITPLQELTEDILGRDAYLFAPETLRIFNVQRSMFSAFSGHREFTTPNESSGMAIYYYLGSDVEEDVKVTVTDPYGNSLRSMSGGKTKGIHRVVWQQRPARRGQGAVQSRQSPEGGATGMGNSTGIQQVLVTLTIGDKAFSQKALILKNP